MVSNNMPYRVVKAKAPGTAASVNLEGHVAPDSPHPPGQNRDVKAPAASPEASNPSPHCIHPLWFQITYSSFEPVRSGALGLLYHLGEHCGIPEESVDFICLSVGIVPEDNSRPSCSGRRDNRADGGTTTPAEIVILVPPSVFDGRPTPLMLSLNYDLARQMRDDGIQNVDIDVYVRDHVILPPNTTNSATGRAVITLQGEELVYLDARAIFEMSKQPRPDDSYADTRRAPEAAEWYTETLAEKEKQAKQQSQLRDKLLGRWVVPPCVRRLEWADLSEDDALEACRIISACYRFIGAGEDEVWYHIQRVSRRHGLMEGARLRAIVTFGSENPAFVGCEHPLLQQFCPAGGCVMKELMNEIKNPRLFT
jgi:hypothetical protein